MGIIATTGLLFGRAVLIPINVTVTAQRLVPDLVTYTLTATLDEAATEAVTATIQAQNANGIGGNWNPVVTFAISETQDIVTFEQALTGTPVTNNSPFTVTVVEHPSTPPTSGYSVNILTPTVNVPAGTNTEFQITPRFRERPLATQVTFDFDLELGGIAVPQDYSIGMRSNNAGNQGQDRDFSVSINDGNTLGGGEFQIASVSGTASYNATFQAVTIPTGFTAVVNPTQITVPEYIPPITPLDFNDRVNFVHSFSDGSLLCVGRFTQYGTTSANAIVKLQPNGNIDTTFNYGTGFASNVSPLGINHVLVQSDGRIICAGRYNSYNGTPAQSIIRLNSDGSVDTSFVYGTGFRIGTATTNTDVIRQLSDGRLVVGGNFTDYNGTTRNSIAILNSNGSVDTGFDPGAGLTRGGNSIGVRTIEIEPTTNRVWVGGDFTDARGASMNRIAKFNTDGTLDTSFSIGTGFLGGHAANAVYRIIYDEGRIYVGGQFGTYNGVTANRIARLNANGSLDTSFNTGIAFQDTAGSILAMDIDSMGNLYCGGSFVQYQGASANRIIKILSSGSRDTTFVVGTGFDNTVHAVIFEASGIILASGDFNTYKGVNVGEIVRLNQSGTPL